MKTESQVFIENYIAKKKHEQARAAQQVGWWKRLYEKRTTCIEDKECALHGWQTWIKREQEAREMIQKALKHLK